MLNVVIKQGRKQITVEHCKSVIIVAASFRPIKRKDFRFKIKAKSYRPKIRDARQ